jgi:pimeloyl-ACP methyl ester carboxylesterase
LHGAADSFLRYRKVVRELALDFEVIVPSLPGFALTGPVALPERQPTRYVAELVWELVHGVLGCERFAIAGGDYGGLVAQILAIDHAESVVGVHLGDVGWHVTGTDPETVTFAERRWLDAAARPLTGDGPCARLAATRPRSVAAALSDSPVGLASWIADRWHAQSGNGGISRDDLLATAMLYWATNTIGSALDAVAADRRSPSLMPADYVARPVALAVSAHDPTGIPPRRLAERTLDIAWWTELPCASQLAALEDPERYAADVGDFFRALRERRESRKELRDDRLAL